MNELLRRLRILDPSAADYVQARLNDPDSYINRSTTKLIQMFSWESTPQGYDYWSRLDDRLESGDISRQTKLVNILS